ncbi:MAG TPA: hypothetical protein VH761_16060, partial [Ilumatobacteraceae bacterium]
MPEVIELLDDDAGAFGEQPGSLTSTDGGSGRWVGPVAGLALVAVIAYGVVTSTSSHGVPEVAPIPTTATPT